MTLVDGLHLDNLGATSMAGSQLRRWPCRWRWPSASPPGQARWRGSTEPYSRFLRGVVRRHAGTGIGSHRPDDCGHGRGVHPVQPQPGAGIHRGADGRRPVDPVRSAAARSLHQPDTLSPDLGLRERHRLHHHPAAAAASRPARAGGRSTARCDADPGTLGHTAP